MIQNILFIDIETVPNKKLSELGPAAYEVFSDRHYWKFQRQCEREEQDEGDKELLNEFYTKEASIHAEFGKIVCISCGLVNADNILKVKTITSRHEKKLLEDFAEVTTRIKVMCAHNGNEFDFPFLFRRYVINGLPVPDVLNITGKKSWEIPHIDTMKLWSHMQWNYKCSIDVLANAFGLPSPKQDMTGADVADVYYGMFDGMKQGELPFDPEEAALKKIGDYCNGDLITLVNVFCKLKGVDNITPEKIQYV